MKAEKVARRILDIYLLNWKVGDKDAQDKGFALEIQLTFPGSDSSS